MVTSWPDKFPGLGDAAERFARTVGQLSAGRLHITVHAGGNKAHALKCHDAVQQGTADLYHSFDHYYGGKAVGYMFFTSAPFGFTPTEMAAWIGHGGGQQIWDAIGADFGVKHLAGGSTGAPTGAWFKTPIKAVADFKDKNVASAGFGAEVIRALGATPRLLSGAEIQTGLAKKSLDGAEWSGPWADAALGLQSSAKHYHYPGLQQPGSLVSLGISRRLWDSLQKSDRALLETAAAQTHNWSVSAFTARNPTALETLTSKNDVKLVALDTKVTQSIADAAADVLAKAGNADELAKKAYASFMAFRKRMAAWTRLADRPFLDRRDLMKS